MDGNKDRGWRLDCEAKVGQLSQPDIWFSFLWFPFAGSAVLPCHLGGKFWGLNADLLPHHSL